MDNIFDGYDYEKEYECSPFEKCNHFSKLMFLIINVNNIPNGNSIIKNYILSNRDEIDKKNAKEQTALMIAAQYFDTDSSLETVKILLENNADVNLTDIDGWTALMVAVGYSNNKINTFEIVKLLLEKGANVNLVGEDGWTALMMAAQDPNRTINLETVKLLLEKGANVNLKNVNGWTALMIAANSNSKNSLEIVRLLLEKGADVNLTNVNGSTALMIAAKYPVKNSSKYIRLLLDKGVNIDQINIDGWTALLMAEEYYPELLLSGLETIKLLLEKGADMYITNQENKIFFNYIPMKYLQECLDIAYQVKHHKLCMKKLLKPINKRSIELLLGPDSLRIKLIGIKWSSNNNLFEELSVKDPSLLSYFGIADEETLKWKVTDNLKNAD